jgi:hypothetical protein
MKSLLATALAFFLVLCSLKTIERRTQTHQSKFMPQEVSQSLICLYYRILSQTITNIAREKESIYTMTVAIPASFPSTLLYDSSPWPSRPLPSTTATSINDGWRSIVPIIITIVIAPAVIFLPEINA